MGFAGLPSPLGCRPVGAPRDVAQRHVALTTCCVPAVSQDGTWTILSRKKRFAANLLDCFREFLNNSFFCFTIFRRVARPRWFRAGYLKLSDLYTQQRTRKLTQIRRPMVHTTTLPTLFGDFCSEVLSLHIRWMDKRGSTGVKPVGFGRAQKQHTLGFSLSRPFSVCYMLAPFTAPNISVPFHHFGEYCFRFTF